MRLAAILFMGCVGCAPLTPDEREDWDNVANDIKGFRIGVNQLVYDIDDVVMSPLTRYGVRLNANSLNNPEDKL